MKESSGSTLSNSAPVSELLVLQVGHRKSRQFSEHCAGGLIDVLITDQRAAEALSKAQR